MITGYNTDVRHGNRIFHVQTEDKGLGNPKIETLIYVGGAPPTKSCWAAARPCPRPSSRSAWTSSTRR